MKRPLLLAVLLTFSSGCATIIQPGPDRISVNSKPSGAKIWLDGQIVGITPTVIPITRASEGVFRLEVEGYEPITIDKDKVVAGWVFGNILIGGFIGIAVDLITHNQGKYSEEPIFVELKPISEKQMSLDSTKIKLKRRAPASE